MALKGKENDPLGGNVLSPTAAAIANNWTNQQGNVRGVYSNFPAMTPKYHTGSSSAGADDVSLERMARMFIAFPPGKSSLKEDFLKTVSGPAKRYAEALAVTGQGATGGKGYIDFLMSQAQESMSENMQVVQVLSDNYISYFFGRTPPVFRYEGVLLNSVQDDWRVAMWLIYNHIIRGTQLARRKVAVTLAYDSVMVTGAIVNMSEILRSDNELAIPFSFSMLVKRFDIVKPPLLGPTPVQTFPWKISADTFASTVVEPAKMSRRTIQDPAAQAKSLSEEAMKTALDQVLFTELYNDVSAAQRATAESVNEATGTFGAIPDSLINAVVEDLNSPA